MMLAHFENKPFGIFAYWAFGFIVSSALFFQLVKFIMKRFGTPKIALRAFDVATIIFIVVGIILMIGKNEIVIVELKELIRVWMSDMSEGNVLYYIYTALGFLAGFIVEFFFRILSRHYDEYRDGVLQKRVLRGDLRMRVRKFCDTWKNRDSLILYIDFRKELVEMTRDIRESLDDEFAQLEKEEKTKIRNITKDFLNLAGKFHEDDDTTWSEKVKSEMKEICKSLEGIVEELT